MSKRTIILASVMIVCNGVIGLCLVMGSIRLLPENAAAETLTLPHPRRPTSIAHPSCSRLCDTL